MWLYSASLSAWGILSFVVMDNLPVHRIILTSFLECGLWKLLMSNLWYTNDFQPKLPIVISCTNCYYGIYLYYFTVTCNQMCMALIKNEVFSFCRYSCTVLFTCTHVQLYLPHWTVKMMMMTCCNVLYYFHKVLQWRKGGQMWKIWYICSNHFFFC